MESPILFACAVPGEHYHRDTGVIIRRDDDGDWMVTVPTRHGREGALPPPRFSFTPGPGARMAGGAVDLIDRLVAGRSRQRRAEGGRVREYREVTNCDLLTALLAVRGQDEAAAYLEDALRSRDHDAVVTAVDTAAYLSTAYARNRPHRSQM